MLLSLFAMAGQGCVHTYQPLDGLHVPVVVDTTAPNLTDVRIRTRCDKGDLQYFENSNLCRKVGVLFENQGATVIADDGGSFGADETEPSESDEVEAVEPTDLSIRLHSRKLYENNPGLTWLICISTFTLLPAVEEQVFAIDVEVHDGTGFLLARETLEGRIVSRYGLGSWAGHKIADFTWRNDDEKFTGDATNQELSADLYGQLSQLVFNAKMQWKLLQLDTADAGQR